MHDLRERPFVVVPSGTLDERDDRLATLAELGPKEIRKEIAAVDKDREGYFGGAVIRDPGVEAKYAANPPATVV